MSELRPSAVVLDLDGTILESEKLARACFQQACLDVGIAEVDLRVYNRCVGTTQETTETIMRKGYGPEFPFDVVLRRWSDIYQTQILQTAIPRRPGIEMLLERLRALQIPMAVVTSSRRTTVETKLNKSELAEYFEFTVCGGETAFGKPDPAPYAKAVERLQCPADRCWALEDSDPGVRSAHAAGLTVFQIPDELMPSEAVRGLGHEILGSPLELLARLI